MPESLLLSPRGHYVDRPGRCHLDPRFWARCFEHHTAFKRAGPGEPAPGPSRWPLLAPLQAPVRARARALSGPFYAGRVLTPAGAVLDAFEALDASALPSFGAS